jgi:hypothetical protein
MADGFHIDVDGERAAKLKAAADAAGMTLVDYAMEALDRAIEADDWAEDLAALEDYDRTGEFVPLEAALEEFNAALQATLAERK